MNNREYYKELYMDWKLGRISIDEMDDDEYMNCSVRFNDENRLANTKAIKTLREKVARLEEQIKYINESNDGRDRYLDIHGKQIRKIRNDIGGYN